MLRTASGGLVYLLFFRLISSVGARKTATVSYLIPLFGTIWGVAVLQERVGLATIIGMIVNLSEVVLITNVRLPCPG